ncbi:MAG: DUF6174 domain-containing protein [Chloroflexi bacterium]|nr:DUF6174 domain-containing protein [Chloroflexota bacterium]
MKRITILLILSVGLLAALACGVDATPTPSKGPGAQTPTATPTPFLTTPTPTPTNTPTPSVTKEWSLERIQVEGSTVTVDLRVFAGIDVKVTLDGRQPDEIIGPPPTLKHIFRNVASGEYTAHISDVVGFTETATVVVQQLVDDENPEWLTDLISTLENEPPGNPPMSITRYDYKEQTVYFQTAPCCDIFSNLYDADGNIIGHPDGGITGQGDGRVPDFFKERQNGRLVWEDRRQDASDMTRVLAPIESVELNIAESFPLQYFLAVTSGLPNSCHTFGGYTVTRDGTDVRVRVFNLRPTDRGVLCAQVYGTVDTNIPLGSDFDPSTAYTVYVNGEVALEFTNDKVTSPLGTAQRELDKNRQIWESQGLTDYRMAFQWFCFCVPEYVAPVVVSVRDTNTIDGVTFSETGAPVDPSSFDRYETVDGLFDLIQAAIDQNAFSISVEYDPELGYPAGASIDYQRLVIDEERGFTAEVLMGDS